jgi:hypothetical protein
MTTRTTTTSSQVLGRLRKGATLAQLAHDMGCHPNQVYGYLTRRPRHTDHMLLVHRELEAKTLRRIRHKWESVCLSSRPQAGTVRLSDQDQDPYGRSLTAILQTDATLVDATEATTGSRNLAAVPDLTEEWAILEQLAALYCHPISRKK